MQDGANCRLVFLVVATRLPIGIWALWLATLATSLQVAFGGGAQPGQACERWNLPIAGVAVQINRVQYFSLSALVREGRPIFVICTQHSAHSRLGRRGRYTARAGLLARSQCARDRMKIRWTRGIDPSSGIRFILFFGYQLSLLHSLRLVVLPAQYPLRLFSRPEAFVAAQISLDRYIWVVLLCQLFT